MAIKQKSDINLTNNEKQIFQFLKQVVAHFNLQTQLRVAGGWVRDKLLENECHDIDIALDNMLGSEFVEKIEEYKESAIDEIRTMGFIYAVDKIKKSGLTNCNPKKSKHLETAKMKMFEMDIDFVNLRAEDYSENSRIPMMKFGTPEVDAYRRDLTINSLFYNIHTCVVEDFTKRGIADLSCGKIVTPLPPRETFLDDPLRILRAIRFGARFEFEIDKRLKEAAVDSEVKAAITEKISRERIYLEIDLMISGNQPVKAMTYISEWELFWVVFNLPLKYEPPISQGISRLCIGYMDAAWRLAQSIGCFTFNDEQRKLSLYAALLLPIRKTVYRDEKEKKIPVVNHIFDSLKQKKIAQTVMTMHNAVDKFLLLIPFLISNENVQVTDINWEIEIIDVPVASKLRVFTGLLLEQIKDLWRAALLLSVLLYPSNGFYSTTSMENIVDLKMKADLYERVENAIIRLDLDKVWELKPLVNGHVLMSKLLSKTGGPIVKEWKEKLKQWQLANPSGTAQESIDWMMRQTQSKRARTELVPWKHRKELVSNLQILGDYQSLLSPPQSVIPSPILAAAKATMSISGMDVSSAFFECLSIEDAPISFYKLAELKKIFEIAVKRSDEEKIAAAKNLLRDGGSSWNALVPQLAGCLLPICGGIWLAHVFRTFLGLSPERKKSLPMLCFQIRL